MADTVVELASGAAALRSLSTVVQSQIVSVAGSRNPVVGGRAGKRTLQRRHNTGQFAIIRYDSTAGARVLLRHFCCLRASVRSRPGIVLCLIEGSNRVGHTRALPLWQVAERKVEAKCKYYGIPPNLEGFISRPQNSEQGSFCYYCALSIIHRL